MMSAHSHACPQGKEDKLLRRLSVAWVVSLMGERMKHHILWDQIEANIYSSTLASGSKLHDNSEKEKEESMYYPSNKN